ncbi:MAG: hypothetical protein ACF8R7_05740 [Phycisphaerales bacterium JB039]
MPSKFGRAPALATCILCGAIGGTVLPAPTHALAQSDTGLFFEAPAALSPAQPSITVRLWAEFPAADYAFASAQFDVLASEPGWSDPTLLWMGPVATTPGAIRGADVLGVHVWQLHFPSGVLADPTNPIEVWKAQFTITDFAPRTIQLSTVAEMFRVYPDKGSSESEQRASHEALHEIRVIPAPGALGLGGVLGLCAVRRRRAARVVGAVVAGALAGGASAQRDNGFILEAPAEVGPGSGRFEVRLLAEFDGRAYDSFAGARLDVRASEAGWSDPELILLGAGTTPGEITGPDIRGLIVGQNWWGLDPDPTNPIAAWKATFTITDFTPRTLRIETVTSAFAVYVEYTYPSPPPVAYPPFHEATREIRVIPAPGALGVGGLVGLGALRRRQNRGPR